MKDAGHQPRANCFRLSHDSAHADSIGIELEPSVEGDVPDIEGAAWLDGASLKLRRIDFRYTRLDLGVSTDDLGGEVTIEELFHRGVVSTVTDPEGRSLRVGAR